MENKVFNFQMSKLATKVINEKLEETFNKLNSAKLKILISLSNVLKNVRTQSGSSS